MADASAGVDERVVVRAWSEQILLHSTLRTRSGEPVQIIYRGRWSSGSGPDFQDALVSLGDGRLLKGDVEAHVRSSDWFLHGHDRDPHYNSVVLHIVLWDDAETPILRQDGKEAPTIALAGSLAVPLERLKEESDGHVDLSPLSDEPCWQYLEETGDHDLVRILDEAGEARFLAKAAAFEAAMVHDESEQVLYESIMGALGYSQNREPFRLVARTVRVESLFSLLHRRPASERILVAEGLLLGAAGLLPSQRVLGRDLDWETASYVEELESAWSLAGWPWAPERLEAGRWQMRGVRPANYPVRRVAAAARLLAAQLDAGLVEALLRALDDPTGDPVSSLVRLFVQPDAGDYWSRHYDFGLAIAMSDSGAAPALVGEQRAQEIAINVALPFLFAWGERSDDSRLASRCREAYRAFPATATNVVVRRMASQLLGPRARRLASTAMRQQGLLHIYRLYCHDRQCLSCPAAALFARPV
ncbi:MAG: DUF2851 family protein [Chloroflexi bacterium]|nr:DUF2851 family protein [Chloroflexota bacterium]